jgi:ABC-2 type transport system ATP-binding protein
LTWSAQHIAATSTAGMSPALVAGLVVLAAVELGLLTWALLDLYRRPKDQINGGSKIPWLVLCLLLQIIGPVVYLTAGREKQAPAAAGRSGAEVPAPRPVEKADAAAVVGHLFAAPATPQTVAGAQGPDGATACGPDGATGCGPAVELRDVRKTFKDTVALDGLTLNVPAGSIYGFLGPNGAGKTTTLRILAGLAHADAGAVGILGRDVAGGADARSLVGYLPDVPAFYKWMTAPEYLRFAGSLFGLSGSELDARVAAILELAGLAGVRTRVGGFSRGMKQRLGVAQALIHGPRLLLLDEPTSALDPIGRRDVLDMVASLRGRTTVFFSTHILADVERVCDTVAVIARGQVVAESGIDELRSRRGGVNRLSIEVDDPRRLWEALAGAQWVRTVEAGEEGVLLVTCDAVEVAQRELPALVGRLGLALRRFGVDELDLEDVFVDLVGEPRR